MKIRNGFTLIEIMVALAIITIALGAIIESTTASNRNLQYLRDRSIATWVAGNELARVRAQRLWSSRSSRSGSVEMGGREWSWKMQIHKTDDPDMRRVEIQVFAEDAGDQPLATMTGFTGRL
jgi:general secretion pathway protein I